MKRVDLKELLDEVNGEGGYMEKYTLVKGQAKNNETEKEANRANIQR